MSQSNLTPATQKAIEALRRIADRTCAVVPDCKGSLAAEKFWCSRCIARAALASLEAEQAAPHEQERECPHRKALASTMAPLLHASQASIEGLSKLGGIGKLNSAARRAYDEAQSALQSPCVPLGEIEDAVAAEREECAKLAETLPTQRTEAAHRVIAATIRARLQEKQG